MGKGKRIRQARREYNPNRPIEQIEAQAKSHEEKAEKHTERAEELRARAVLRKGELKKKKKMEAKA